MSPLLVGQSSEIRRPIRPLSSLPHGSGIPYGDSLRKLGLPLKEVPRQDMIITGRLCCHSSSAWGGDGEPDFSAERVVRDVETRPPRRACRRPPMRPAAAS